MWPIAFGKTRGTNEVETLDALISAIANHGNIAVLVLMVANTWLIWMIKHGIDLWREQTREHSAALKSLSDALVELRITIAADRKGR